MLTSVIIAEDEEIMPADVVLLEEDLNSRQGILACRDFYNRGYCREIWAVRIADTSAIFNDGQYVSWIQHCMDSLGYGIKITPFVFNVEHPVTMNKAKALVDSLLSRKYYSVILVTNAFHSRRSLKVYRKILESTGISIQSSVYYSQANRDDWWKSSYGIRYVIPEILKYLYYFARGYY